MKNVYLFLLAFIILAGFSNCTRRPTPSSQNHSFEYQPGTAFQHDWRAEGDSLHLFLLSADSNFFASPRKMRVSYAAYLDYESRDPILMDSVAYPYGRMFRTRNGVVFDFKIAREKLKLPAVLLVKFVYRNDPDHVLVHDMMLTPKVWDKNYLLLNGTTGLPLFGNFVGAGESVTISGVSGKLQRYSAVFSAALPPMALPENQKAQPTLKPLETIPFINQPISLLQPGLYGIMTDDKVSGGFLKVEGSFPELSTASDLIQPLIYLTTSAERDKLYKNKDTKAAIDKFWLTIAPNQNQARFLIRNYYGRVETANRLFTAHKAGWLTDRGMIYIIFGPPDEVKRHQVFEEWTYTATGQRNEVRFVFSRKDNTFTQNYYELARSPAYESIWYGMVELWRNGTIEK